MSKPQMLVKFRAGDHAVFDIESLKVFSSLKTVMEDKKYVWMALGENVLVIKQDIERLIYLPDGYAQNSQSNVPQT